MTETDSGRRVGRRRLALGVLLAAQLMLIVDIVVLNVALPSIRRSLDVPEGQIQLASIAYTVTFGGLLIVAGRAGDLLGRRRVFWAGLAVFTVASAFTGASQQATHLFAGRALQGLGAAMVSPTALALLTSTFREGTARNRALGLWAAVGAGGAIVGQVLGGVVADLFGWRWIFFLNVPVGVAALLLAPRMLPESRSDDRPRLDLGGAVTLAGGVGVASLALARASQHGIDRPATALAVGALALLVGFVAVERRHASPLVRFDLLRTPGVRIGNGVLALIAGATAPALLFATLYLQDVLRYTPLAVGVAFAPVTLVVMAVSPVAGRLVGRYGVRPLLTGGCLVSAAGFALLATAGTTGTYLTEVLPGLVLVALGNGLAFAPTMIAATSGVAHRDQGLASGVLSTAQELGTALGLAVLAAVATAASDVTEGVLPAGAAVEGYRVGFVGAVLLAGLGALVATRAPRDLGRAALGEEGAGVEDAVGVEGVLDRPHGADLGGGAVPHEPATLGGADAVLGADRA
jgi:EmrB/QacA subfamily drug resistance transporter